ncbi:hypothetical protein K443DRAFT_16030 [Laccaria amethystina LaAM-08-1]|uniref:Uncharacterized protein n=1 Tax=Laccaria amethystina LaAM-08-1 TaxID=1095629 RepID=A0A0C9WPN3_9AGAR|nr:hypothetical protein K443DRAFT_16030 [Laccaria amethystina LaAM-08-1]
MSSSNEGLLPKYIGIRPPADFAAWRGHPFVYGFPLSYEWLQHRYHHDVKLQASEGAPVQDQSAYLARLAWDLSGVCQKIHRVKCTTTVVATSGYGNGQAMFLIVGYPGRKPPPKTLETFIDKLKEDYGIIEDPGWYPRA